MMLFPNLHKMAGRAIPDKMIDYKLALQLFRVVNYNFPTPNWINVNLNKIQTTRQTKFIYIEDQQAQNGNEYPLKQVLLPEWQS